MTGKRKRTRSGRQADTGSSSKQYTSADTPVKHALLLLYYHEVLTLREYLLSKLPATSKVRRRKILSIGRDIQQGKPNDEDHEKLAWTLDQTLVGVLELKEKDKVHVEPHQLQTFLSQRRSQDDSRSGEKSVLGSSVSQSEVIDCSIWLLFQKARKTSHLLCQGYQRDVRQDEINRGQAAISSIPGIASFFPNSNVEIIKSGPWPQILALMGKEGEKYMIDLVLYCGIFLAIEGGQGNYHQLSGIPLGDLEVRPRISNRVGDPKGVINTQAPAEKGTSFSTPGNIIFVRNRMLYARAALNARGTVQFGLRHIHALNRYPYKASTQHDEAENNEFLKTVIIMKYIFPRQFGLHNVFTSKVDRQETVHPFKDYTMREDEINMALKKSGSSSTTVDTKVPKRLRGLATALTEKLRKLHVRCPYNELLKHYCPTSPDVASQEDKTSHVLQTLNTSAIGKGQMIAEDKSSDMAEALIEPSEILPPKLSLLDRATPVGAVSAFCRAVFNKLIPNDFWGTGQVQERNRLKFLSSIDKFVKLRRFEKLSLHEVVQEMKITEIEWLCPPGLAQAKTSQTDLNKRLEIFHEFIYYLFDSLLIPLIRANFHVTESNVHSNRLFFFRHDVWRELSEPAMASLKADMFEEVKHDTARRILASRSLGFSQIRLLPKAAGVRPIMNLRRKTLKKGSRTILGYSINSTLAPVYNMLTYEKNTNPERLGSTMFSVGDMYPRLKAYKSQPRPPNTEFYFAKVDVQAAFDTIPQSAVVNLMQSLPSESTYRIAKHAEIKPGDGYRLDPSNTAVKPIRKWINLAKPLNDPSNFHDNLSKDQGLAIDKKNTVFVENVTNNTKETNQLLRLLEDHIKCNLVKIGKKFYRQKTGIPQGSVISSLLCNYFYADLESQHLSFLNTEESDSLLIRLLDDFLLITTNKSHAVRFLDIMHHGLPSYGVIVKPFKTLTNFPASFNSKSLPILPATSNKNFPYCGTRINTQTLSISRDRTPKTNIIPPIETKTDTDRNNNLNVKTQDSLTIEFCKLPGKTFQRKIQGFFKIQAHAMFFDTRFNGVETVARNLYRAFGEVATKMVVYRRCLAVGKRPGTELMCKTIERVVELAVALCRSRERRRGKMLGLGMGMGMGMGKDKGKDKGRDKEDVFDLSYKFGLSKVQVEWLALKAFGVVMRRRQSGLGEVLRWVEGKALELEMDGKRGVQCRRVMGMV